MVTRIGCEALDAEFVGVRIPCDPNPCPQPQEGICCIQTGECRFVTAPVCDDLRGIFLTETGACLPNPCYGACCFYNGQCQMQALYWCEPLGGEFMGAGSDCDPNPCLTSGIPENAVHETTWGTIKARYRE